MGEVGVVVVWVMMVCGLVDLCVLKVCIFSRFMMMLSVR